MPGVFIAICRDPGPSSEWHRCLGLVCDAKVMSECRKSHSGLRWTVVLYTVDSRIVFVAYYIWL